ncbi:MAG: GGDEF domain-containing protein, partial [Psychrobium sp.]
HNTVMLLAAVLFIFIGISVSLFIRHRLMAMKVAISMKDALTGAYARSYLKHFLPLVKQSLIKDTNLETSFGLMLIDCDDFKKINDKFGHGGGDVALKKIVETIKAEISDQDTLFRWGGDEFVLMCQSVSKAQLNDISSRINKAVCNLNIIYGEAAIHPTISIGYALHARNNPLNLDELLKVADDYLYQSKRAGKNSVFGI